MYNYMNIGSMSIFLMSLYIVYGNYKGCKNKFDLTLIYLLGLIVTYKIIFNVSYAYPSFINLNSIYKVLIILLIIRLNDKEIKDDKLKRINIISYIICFLYMFTLVLGMPSVYSNLMSIYLLTTTVYLSCISIYNCSMSNKNRIIVTMYLCEIFMSIFINDIRIMNFGYIIDFITSICVFYGVYTENIKRTNEKNKDIGVKVSCSNIEIEEKEIKTAISRDITHIINKNFKKKKKLLEVILDQCDRCVIVIDSAGYIVNEDSSFSKMWNEYKEYAYKLSLSTFLEKSVENKGEFLEYINTVNETKEAVIGEFQGTDGRFFKCRYSPFIISEKNMGVICDIEDITYRIKSEIRIQENNAKYRTIVENIPYSIILAEEDQIIYDNDKFHDIDLNRKDVEDIVRKIHISEDVYGEVDYNNYRHNSVCLNVDRVEFSDKDKNKKLIAIRNITEYKRILEEANYSKQKYETLVNIIPEGIYIADLEGNTPEYANVALHKITNSRNSEEINLNLINADMIATPITNEKIKFIRKSILNEKGDYTHIECGGTVINVNKSKKIVGVIRDITEQVKAEQIEIEIEKKKIENKNKFEFFVNISHELKTPLNIISSSNQLLEVLYRDELSKNPKSEISRAIENVKFHSNMVMKLVDNMMDLARLESDFHQSELDYYNIVNIVEDIVEEFSRHIDKSSVELIFDTDEEEIISNIDPNDIEKVVLIILSMVIRYSDAKSIIKAEIKSEEEKNVIEITNKGGYNHKKFINDVERKSIDVGIEVAKQIIELYNGSMDINIGSSNDIQINIGIQVDKERDNYKERARGQVEDLVYLEYIRMCNF